MLKNNLFPPLLVHWQVHNYCCFIPVQKLIAKAGNWVLTLLKRMQSELWFTVCWINWPVHAAHQKRAQNSRDFPKTTEISRKSYSRILGKNVAFFRVNLHNIFPGIPKISLETARGRRSFKILVNSRDFARTKFSMVGPEKIPRFLENSQEFSEILEIS